MFELWVEYIPMASDGTLDENDVGLTAFSKTAPGPTTVSDIHNA